MITRRQVLSLPVVPAAVAFVQRPASPDATIRTPEAADGDAASLADSLVNDDGWLVTSADRDAIAVRRRVRRARAATPAPSPTPPTRRRRRR